jgi:transcription antitermination factor NusG
MPVLRPQWYVFAATPNCESRICKALGRQAIEALAPRTVQFVRISRRRVVETDGPVFPGYVFACVWGPLWRRLRTIPHLRPQPLAMDGEPYRLSAADVAYIRSLAAMPPTDPRAPIAPDRYKAGELVKFTGGPFEAHRGTVDTGDADDGAHVRTLVALFGKLAPYCAPREWVERAA